MTVETQTSSASRLSLLQQAPLVTVVIPTYNHSHYLRQALTSVLHQSYPNFDVVVVDDGSTDDTPEVVPHGDPRIRYIRQANQGLSAARNTGIREARGTVISLLDADDLYEPAFLEVMVGELRRHPEVSAVYCGHQCVDQWNGRLPYSSTRVEDPGRLYEALLCGNFLVPACMVALKACYDTAGGFDTALTACEDWDVWLRFARTFKVCGVPQKLVRYRVVTGSMSSDPNCMLINREAVLRKHLPVGDSSSSLSRRAQAEAYLRTAVECIQTGDEESACRLLERMALRLPSLLSVERTFYELACGIQPRGFSGDISSINLAASEQMLMRLLNQLFRRTGQVLAPYHRRSVAYAYFALAKLSYTAHRFVPAGRYLRRAVSTDVCLLWNRELVGMFIKSCLLSRSVRSVPVRMSSGGRLRQRQKRRSRSAA